MGRLDFGTYLYTLCYIFDWTKLRGSCALIVITSRFDQVDKISQLVCRKSFLILPPRLLTILSNKIFGYVHTYESFCKVFKKLKKLFPDAIVIYDGVTEGPYLKTPELKIEQSPGNFSKEFIEAYKDLSLKIDYHEKAYYDMRDLYYNNKLERRSFFNQKLSALRNNLGIREKYAIINLNCKNYPCKLQNRRKIEFPEKYNCLIDFLISHGYNVVLQGRQEQPFFEKRKGFIDYSKSYHCSQENDLALFSGASFAILGKSGPEVYSTLCDIPVLGLNYTELCSIIPNTMLRYYPKHVKKLGKYLNWQDYLKSSAFYGIGIETYDADIEYEEMTEEEIIEAALEFLPLIDKKPAEWVNYSFEQLLFKQSLYPIHLDPYYIKGVPLNCYLKREKNVKNEQK